MNELHQLEDLLDNMYVQLCTYTGITIENQAVTQALRDARQSLLLAKIETQKAMSL